MSRKRIVVAAIAVAGIALAYVGTRDQGRPEYEYQRPGLVLPAPTTEQRVEFFYRTFKSGDRTTLQGTQIPVWRDFGEMPMLEQGVPALDFLLSPDRYKEYRSAPNILANLLRVLPRLRAAAGHPQLYPFLLHWLDPDNCPTRTPNADWPSDIRKDVFSVIGAFPAAAAVPYCLEELRRAERVHDLRAAALATLIRVGDGATVNDLFETLPPNAREAAPDLRTEMVLSLYRLAAPTASETAHAIVDEMDPLLKKALASARDVERFNAMGVLYRRGQEQMADELIEFFEQRKATDAKTAWSALMLVVRDRPHPVVKDICVAELARPAKTLPYQTAAGLVARWWAESEPAQTRLWQGIERRDVHPLQVLPDLVITNRARVVAYLRTELESGDTQRVNDAVRLIVGKRMRELSSDLATLVRAVPRRQRPFLYRALVLLRAPGVEPLLLAELVHAEDPIMRGAAIEELLNLGTERAVARVREALEEGDPVSLEVLLTRVGNSRAAGVPEALVPAVLGVLRTAPGEDARRSALFILRYRGRLEGVAAGLLEAYRREPSRRRAQEIQAVLIELAHR